MAKCAEAVAVRVTRSVAALKNGLRSPDASQRLQVILHRSYCGEAWRDIYDRNYLP